MNAPGSNDRFASLEVEPSRRNQERFHHEEHEEARRGLNFRKKDILFLPHTLRVNPPNGHYIHKLQAYPVLRHLMPFRDIKLYLATNKAFLCR
jgi:hypothetical protein